MIGEDVDEVRELKARIDSQEALLSQAVSVVQQLARKLDTFVSQSQAHQPQAAPVTVQSQQFTPAGAIATSPQASVTGPPVDTIQGQVDMSELFASQPAQAAQQAIPQVPAVAAMAEQGGRPMVTLGDLIELGKSLGVLKTPQHNSVDSTTQAGEQFIGMIEAALNLVGRLEQNIYERMRATSSMVRSISNDGVMEKLERFASMLPPDPAAKKPVATPKTEQSIKKPVAGGK